MLKVAADEDAQRSVPASIDEELLTRARFFIFKLADELKSVQQVPHLGSLRKSIKFSLSYSLTILNPPIETLRSRDRFA